MRVCCLRRIASQPRACAGVGASKRDSNQLRTAGWKRASGSAGRPEGSRIVVMRGGAGFRASPVIRPGKGGRSPAVVTARGPGRTPQVWAGRSYHRVPGSRRSRALAPPTARALRTRFTMCSARWRRPAGFVPGCMWSSAGGLAPHSGFTSRLRLLPRIRRSRSPAVPRTDALPAVHADQGDPGPAGGLWALGMSLTGVPHSSGRARAES